METRFRRYARVAAVADLILTILELLLSIIAFIWGYTQSANYQNSTETPNNQTGNEKSDTIPGFYGDADSAQENYHSSSLFSSTIVGLVLVVVLLGLTILYFSVQFWAAISLLKATEFGRETTDALRLSRIWMIVTVVLVVLETIVNLFKGVDGLIVLVIVFTINAGFVYVVHQFRKELKEIRGQPLNSFPI